MTVSQALIDFRARAVAAGKCNRCGKHDHAPLRVRCQACIDEAGERYAKRKRQKRCTGCNAALLKRAPNPCDACHLKREQRRNQMRADAIATGMCSRCFKVTAMPDRRRCRTCTEEARGRTLAT